MSESNPFLKSIRESAGIRLAVLFGSFFVMLLLSSIISQIISQTGFSDDRTQTLISASIQCVLAFIIPAFILAKFCSKNANKWLKINTRSGIMPFIGIIIVYLLSLPAMEWLVEWNSNLHLPSAFQSIENVLRSWEDASEATTKTLLGTHSMGGIIAGILVIGVLTGFSEELFFRGGLQGILVKSRIGYTTAIWLSAFIFSTMHFQFFGFVPRLLMGAFFGYLLIWTKDIKVSSFAHILNNSIVVITAGFNGGESLNTSDISLFKDFNYLPLVSVVATVLFLVFFKGIFFTNKTVSWQRSQLPPVSGR